MSKRPYPNVVRAGSRWEARHPRNGVATHLGLYDTAEDARVAVLKAQVTHLDAKATECRREAARITAMQPPNGPNAEPSRPGAPDLPGAHSATGEGRAAGPGESAERQHDWSKPNER